MLWPNLPIVILQNLQYRSLLYPSKFLINICYVSALKSAPKCRNPSLIRAFLAITANNQIYLPRLKTLPWTNLCWQKENEFQNLLPDYIWAIICFAFLPELSPFESLPLLEAPSCSDQNSWISVAVFLCKNKISKTRKETAEVQHFPKAVLLTYLVKLSLHCWAWTPSLQTEKTLLIPPLPLPSTVLLSQRI